MSGRLTGWLVLVLALAGSNYAVRFTAGKPERNLLYQWSTVAGSLFEFGLIFGIVLLIARDEWGLLAWRRPRSWRRATGIGVAVLIGVYLVGGLLSPFLQPGQEQGLAPERWQPSHAAAFAANALVVCAFAPLVEESTFRGVGFSLIEPRWGTGVAVVSTAVFFGLAHGLVEALPVLVAFGLGLAWLRMRTDSAVPGMIAHGTFNALALLLSLTT